MLIKIISVPEGEAPEKIRQAWVGLILPVSRTSGFGPEGTFLSRGVLSRDFAVVKGFAVQTSDAIRVLELANKTEAAKWWTAHRLAVTMTIPFANPYELIFRREECQPFPRLELSEVQFHIEQTVLTGQSQDVPIPIILRANHILDRWLEAHGLTNFKGSSPAEDIILIPFWSLLGSYGISLTNEQKEEIVRSHKDD